MTVLLFIVPAALAAALAYALTPLSRAIARRVGALDQPGPRKVHQTPTPRLGGIAVVAAAAIVFAAMALSARARMPSSGFLLAVAVGLVPVIAGSLLDDLRGLRALPKLLIHLLGATITVLLG